MMWALIVSAPIFAGSAPLGGVSSVVDFQESAPASTAPQVAAPATPVMVPTEREKELLARIAVLEEELLQERARAMARQGEWIEYVRVLERFNVPALPKAPDFISQAIVPEEDPADDALRRQHLLRLARGSEILNGLRGLLIADGVRTLDFLEVGLVDNHRGTAATGPVVARLLDDRGRLTGMLRAERLRIEVSRAARTVTLVLEDGFEMSGGRKYPFPGTVQATADTPSGIAKTGGGVRRILLPSIDPTPWIESLPDLVDASDLAVSFDDGNWDSVSVRAALNRLLAASAPAGGVSWKLLAVSGISKNRLNDVQFLELGPDGGVRRRVFADEATVHVPKGSQAVRIELESGSVKRGSRVAPFLGGRYRISLPFAKVKDWESAEIPKARR